MMIAALAVVCAKSCPFQARGAAELSGEHDER